MIFLSSRKSIMTKQYSLGATTSIMLTLTALAFTETDIHKILYLNSLIPPNTELRKRILTTIYCDDCLYLPKVAHAGEVLFDKKLEIEYQLMHNGLRILKDCYYGSWITTLIKLLKGHHEPQEEKIFHEVIKSIPDNATMVELGSYWGYYSMWFQKQIPGAKNYLIEPDPKNLAIGKYNFALNNSCGHFTQAMVGKYSADNQLFTDWNYDKYYVKQINVDDFATKNRINFIHLLHSDIQGAELDMLKGCQKLIAEKRIGYFFISTHKDLHRDCLKLLQDAHLEILISITRDESFSADGLIVAKLPDIKGPQKLELSKRTASLRSLIDKAIDDKS